MPLSPKEELELLQLEEEEYQHSIKAKSPAAPAVKDPSQMSPQEIEAADDIARKEYNGKELAPLLAGAAQGSTFGFSDELGAAKDVVGDMLTGNTGPNLSSQITGEDTSLSGKWRKYQKGREAVNKQLQEESPGMYMAGELGAGVATSLAMPGLGGAKLVGAAGKLSPKVAAFLAGKLGGVAVEGGAALTSGAKALNSAGRVAASGIEAAPIGALYGAGSSENDLSKPLELGADMASGATMGLITGGGLRAAGETSAALMNKAKNISENGRFFRQTKKAYDYGKEGIDIGSANVQDELSLLPNTKSKEFVDKVFAVDAQLGQKVGDSITNAQQAGVKINIDPKLQEVGQRIFKTLYVDNPTLGEIIEPRAAKLIKTIAQKEAGDLTPVEAKALRDELYSLQNKLSAYNSDTATFAKQVGYDMAKTLDTTLKTSIPEYQAAAKEFEAFRRLVPETVISKGTPSDLGKVFVGDLKNPELKLFESSRAMLGHSQMPGMGVEAERQTFQQLKNNLKELEKTNPKAVQDLGGKNAAEVTQGLRNTSDELGMLRQAQGHDPHANLDKLGTGQIFGLATSASGKGFSIANKAGLAVNKINQSTPVKMGTALFNAADDQLRNLAGALKADSATAIMGDALENALNKKNDVAKNAVLFKLMQNPDYRNLLRQEGLASDTSEDNK